MTTGPAVPSMTMPGRAPERLRLAAALVPPAVLVVLLVAVLLDGTGVSAADAAASDALRRPDRNADLLHALLVILSTVSLPAIGWAVAAAGAVGLGRGRLMRALRRPSYVGWAFEWGSARAPLWGPPLGIAVTVAAAEAARFAILAVLRGVDGVGGVDPQTVQTFTEHHTMTTAAVVGSLLTAHGIRRRISWVGAVLLVAAVAYARLTAGGLPLVAELSGLALGTTAVIAGRAAGLLTDGPVWNLVLRHHRRRHPPRRLRAGVVLNPTKFADPVAFQRRVGAALSGESAIGSTEVFDVSFYETSPTDPGRAMTEQALADGVDLLVAAGGDGTVRTVCTAAAGSGVRIGIVPAGTSNLLARNLRLPLQEGPALDVVAGGVDRAIDLARISGDGLDAGEGFVVMAGLGLDGAIMAEVPDRLKKLLGLPAYIVTGARHLRDAPVEVEVTVDDGPPIRRMVRMVVVGNVGSVQVFKLLPDAQPDDGILDVVIVAPETARSTLRVVWNFARRARDPDVEHLHGRSVRIRSDGSVPRQLDGDVMPGGREITVSIDPGSVIVRVPNRR